MWYPRFAPLALAAAGALGVSGLLAASARPAAAQESAIDALRRDARQRPGDAAAALALGRALRRAGHAGEALAELGRGIAVAPASSSVLLRLRWESARAQVDRHDFYRALAACGALGHLRGAEAEGHACTAAAHLVWQRATEALSEAALALAADPRCYEAKVVEGRAYELAIEPAQAEASFRAALALGDSAGKEGTDTVEARVGLGRVLLRQGRKEEGLAELRGAVQAAPADPDALYELGAALAPSDESASLLGRATRERPSFPQAWLALGTEQLAAGRVDEARGAAAAAVRGDPGSVAAHVLAGNVALAEGHADDALAEGQAATKIVANNAAAALLVADAYARKGDIDSALDAYQSAWGYDHADPSPLVRAAVACHAAARDTSARAFGAKAVEEFPGYAPAWAALGDALAGQHEAAAARDAYRKALSAAGGAIDRAAVQGKLSALQ